MFPKIILILFLAMAIVYINVIPTNIRILADSIPGRLIGFALILLSYNAFGWLPAILVTLIVLLLISGGIMRSVNEGFMNNSEHFSSDINIVEKKPGTKWWDEVILGRESIVKTNLVDTMPIQG
jgi:hypothetical protein